MPVTRLVRTFCSSEVVDVTDGATQQNISELAETYLYRGDLVGWQSAVIVSGAAVAEDAVAR
jgi:hypothetical protein